MSSSNPHLKRKRVPFSLSTTTTPSTTPGPPTEESINPFSHSPDTLKQFARAGYLADQPLPSELYPGFPHRGPDRRRQPHGRRRRRDVRGKTRIQDDNDDDDEETPAYRSSAASDGDDEMMMTAAPTTADTDVDTDADPVGGQTTASATTDAETSASEGDGNGSGRRRRTATTTADRKARAYESRVGCLVAVVRRCLAAGDVATARRAFGLLARARVGGRPVDLRYRRLWEMGAEVLMREGEGEGEGRGEGEGNQEEQDDDVARSARRAEKKLTRLKRYYEYLARRYPFTKFRPDNADSAVAFQAALFGAEMEAAYAAHRAELERLERGGEDADAMDVDDEEPMGYDRPHLDDVDGYREQEEGLLLPGGDGKERSPGLSRLEARRREREDALRLAALQTMLDVAERMDTVMETAPFSQDHELLRLRAAVALYVGDLHVPPAPRSNLEDVESRGARAEQHRKAKGFLRKIEEGGGVLSEHDKSLLESLPSDDEGGSDGEEEGSALPMFSSIVA